MVLVNPDRDMVAAERRMQDFKLLRSGLVRCNRGADQIVALLLFHAAQALTQLLRARAGGQRRLGRRSAFVESICNQLDSLDVRAYAWSCAFAVLLPASAGGRPESATDPA